MAVLCSASIVIHCVHPEIDPRSSSCDISRLLAKRFMKGIHSFTSLSQATTSRFEPVWPSGKALGW